MQKQGFFFSVLPFLSESENYWEILYFAIKPEDYYLKLIFFHILAYLQTVTEKEKIYFKYM